MDSSAPRRPLRVGWHRWQSATPAKGRPAVRCAARCPGRREHHPSSRNKVKRSATTSRRLSLSVVLESRTVARSGGRGQGRAGGPSEAGRLRPASTAAPQPSPPGAGWQRSPKTLAPGQRRLRIPFARPARRVTGILTPPHPRCQAIIRFVEYAHFSDRCRGELRGEDRDIVAQPAFAVGQGHGLERLHGVVGRGRGSLQPSS